MIQGSIVALVTPMFEDGAVDDASLKKLVEFLKIEVLVFQQMQLQQQKFLTTLLKLTTRLLLKLAQCQTK